MAYLDLAAPAQVLALLAERGLTAAELAAVPQLIPEASAQIRTFCRRVFTSSTFDEVYQLDAPDREITLRQFPVLDVDSVRAGLSEVVTISNTSAGVQRATVKTTGGGDGDPGPAPAGITLTALASGVKTVRALPFAGDPAAVPALPALPTLSALAAAVAALGGGWTASVAKGYELWPAADVYSVARSGAAGGQTCGLLMFVDELGHVLDRRLGVLALGTDSGASADSPRWGPTWSGEFQDVDAYEGGVRVVYTAGYATVPADVVLGLAETVKAALDRLRTDYSVLGESDGTISWTGRNLAELTALPLSVRSALSYRINHR